MADTGPTLPPAPPAWEVPAELIDKWRSVPEGRPLVLHATKDTIDHLFFAIFNALNSTALLDLALTDYSNGRTEEANQRLLDSRTAGAEGLSRARKMLADLIASAEVANG